MKQLDVRLKLDTDGFEAEKSSRHFGARRKDKNAFVRVSAHTHSRLRNAQRQGLRILHVKVNDGGCYPALNAFANNRRVCPCREGGSPERNALRTCVSMKRDASTNRFRDGAWLKGA
jgi:hypothetical protein